MKRNFIKKLSVTLVVALLLVNLFVFGVVAADDGEYVKWWLSDDQTQIVNETENITYNNVFYGKNLRPVSDEIFVYSQYLTDDGAYYYDQVQANPDYPEVIWVDGYGYTEIFATDRGAADLKSFVNGNIGSLRLEDRDGLVSDISEDLVAEWDAALRSDRNTEVFDVIDIKPNGKKVEVYEIAAVDVTKTLAYSYGAVYRLSGEYWYVNYADLANNYFDANGSFSYRSGSIKMTRISDTSELGAVISNTRYHYSEYTYEWNEPDYDYYEDNSDGLMVLFWIFYAIFIVIPPIPVIILGLILPFIKKLGKPKYWFALSAFALLWLIFAIALAILLILV